MPSASALRRISVHIDSHNLSGKPTEQDLIDIAHRHRNPVLVTLPELIRKLLPPFSRTFTPGNCRGWRENESWYQQEVFVLDFDNKKSGKLLFDDLLRRCDEFEIEGTILPAFAYTTFSSVKEERYRVGWVLDRMVTDVQDHSTIMELLLTLFPEADRSCRHRCALFHGGKELLFENYDQELTPHALLQSAVYFLRVGAGHRNAARRVRQLCAKLQLGYENGFPAVDAAVRTSDCRPKNDADSPSPNRARMGAAPPASGQEASPPSPLNIRPSGRHTSCFNYVDQQEVERSIPRATQTFSSNHHREVVRNVDWDRLEGRSSLFRGFLSGDAQLDHHQVLGLGTNLVYLEGGQAKFLEGIDRHHRYATRRDKYQTLLRQIVDHNYQPFRFSTFHPASEAETGCLNLVQAARLQWGEVIVRNPITARCPEVISAEMQEGFEAILQSLENKVYLIKAPTGVGKSEMILMVQGAVIAVPTHKLKEELAQRCREAGNDVLMTPELPPDCRREVKCQIEQCYRVGAYHQVKGILRHWSDECPASREYLRQLEEIEKDATRTVITTHEMLLSNRITRPLVIIDEDPLGSLLKQGPVRLTEALRFIEEEREQYYPVIEKVEGLEVQLRSMEVGHVYSNDNKVAVKDYYRLETRVRECNLSSNFIGLLTADCLALSDDGVIHYIQRRSLPSQKTIILSATADPAVYRELAGDRLQVHDLGHSTLRGELIQYPQWSCSKYFMRNNTDIVALAQSLVPDADVITFKDPRIGSMFDSSVVMHFGNLRGINAKAGCNLAIVGTYHIHPLGLRLIATALRIKVSADCKPKNLVVSRNGMDFRFHTYEQPDLQNLHLSLVESELIQAVGRARLVREECAVTLFSNYPLPGADFRSMTKEEINTKLKELGIVAVESEPDGEEEPVDEEG